MTWKRTFGALLCATALLLGCEGSSYSHDDLDNVPADEVTNLADSLATDTTRVP